MAEARKGFDLVALDDRRRIVCSRGGLSETDAVRLVAEDIRPGVVCIDSPPGWAHSGRSRAAERELAALGFPAFPVGADPGDHPFYRWMRAGMGLYQGLADTYPRYRSGALRDTAFEVYPHASAQRLAGRRRPAGTTKTTFRRDALAAHGVDEAQLTNLDRVDAALCALTGLLALHGCFEMVGDTLDGVVVLPELSR